MAQEAGYECAITVDPGFNSQNTDLFKLKRLSIKDDADVNELIVKASGLWAYTKKLLGHQNYGYTILPDHNSDGNNHA